MPKLRAIDGNKEASRQASADRKPVKNIKGKFPAQNIKKDQRLGKKLQIKNRLKTAEQSDDDSNDTLVEDKGNDNSVSNSASDGVNDDVVDDDAVEQDLADDDDDELIDDEEIAALVRSEKSSAGIYHTAALEAVLENMRRANGKKIEASTGEGASATAKLPFSELQMLVSGANVDISDVNNDLERELQFYKQGVEAATLAYKELKREGVAFVRPDDYFAEMVKSDEHMERVKNELVREAQDQKARELARRQRELKKVGKEVQVQKMLDRQKEKRRSEEKIKLLRKRAKSSDIADDDFDIALDDNNFEENTGMNGESGDRKRQRMTGRPKMPREARNQKYGFGGKKRFKKSNDRQSTVEFNPATLKSRKSRNARPGKSKRVRSKQY